MLTLAEGLGFRATSSRDVERLPLPLMLMGQKLIALIILPLIVLPILSGWAVPHQYSWSVSEATQNSVNLDEIIVGGLEPQTWYAFVQGQLELLRSHVQEREEQIQETVHDYETSKLLHMLSMATMSVESLLQRIRKRCIIPVSWGISRELKSGDSLSRTSNVALL